MIAAVATFVYFAFAVVIVVTLDVVVAAIVFLAF